LTRITLAMGIAACVLARPVAAQDNFTPEVRLLVGIEETASEPSRAALGGIVGWRATPLLLDELEDIGVGRGWYRRTFMFHDADTGRYIGEDFAFARARGMNTLLTCVGTPQQLSPYPEKIENEYGTGLPQFARFMPTSASAWANYLLLYLDDMETEYGVLPDCIELWNEVERVEWGSCTLTEYLEFYSVVSKHLRAARPNIRLGGPGLAGARSTMGGSESVLFAMIRNAASSNAPLDFVSWHHYAPGSELRLSQMPVRLRALGAELGHAGFEVAVTEWNIAPSAQGALGPEFDGPHAAANLLNFYATAALHDLDRNYCFLDRDEENDRGITDFEGVSLGLITKHGLRKPISQVIKLMLDPAFDEAVPVEPPTDEYNVMGYASRNGNVVRIMVGNDVVTASWLFTNSARQYGMEPGWLYPLWLAAGGPRATLATLLAEGLTLQQAEVTMAFMPAVLLSDFYSTHPRTVHVELLGSAPFTINRVIRFNESVNAPAQHRAALLPFLTTAFDRSMLLGCDASALLLTTAGYPTTSAEVFAALNQFFDWAAARGIPYGIAVSAWKTFQDTRRDTQLLDAQLLNSLPETQLKEETAAEAGITVTNRELLFQLEPNTVLMLEVTL